METWDNYLSFLKKKKIAEILKCVFKNALILFLNVCCSGEAGQKRVEILTEGYFR